MKFISIMLMIAYLYVLTFGIFLNDLFRLPAPAVFAFPLIFLFKDAAVKPFPYSREIIALAAAVFGFYVFGLNELNSFAANLITILVCAGYFHFFVGSNAVRFKWSVYIFFGLLFFSSIVMLYDSFKGVPEIRSMLLGTPIVQSPSGISGTQFAFGYQVAALSTFLSIYACACKKNILIIFSAVLVSLTFLLFGMQRSAFVAFLVGGVLFSMAYYQFKSVVFVLVIALGCVFVYNSYVKDSLTGPNNIITKEENNDDSYNRSTLVMENLRIFSDYPMGLIFYGKNWSDVIYRNSVFSSGITSHNAYMMFITYLGPILGIGLLLTIYRRMGEIFSKVVRIAKERKHALLVALSFALLAISINSLSHNAWLISADGPTVFLFFSVLHLYNISFKALTEKNSHDEN